MGLSHSFREILREDIGTHCVCREPVRNSIARNNRVQEGENSNGVKISVIFEERVEK